MKVAKKVLVLALLLLIVPTANAWVIAQYPWVFTHKGTFDAYFVVGASAPALDVVSATELSVGVAKYKNMKQNIGSALLDNEVSDIKKINAVVIGSPCENDIAAELEGHPTPCDAGLETGKGYIKFFLDPKEMPGVERMPDERVYRQILITGKTAEDRNVAAKWLANKPDNWFTSEKIVVVSRDIKKGAPQKKITLPHMEQTKVEREKKPEPQIIPQEVVQSKEPNQEIVMKTYEFQNNKQETFVVRVFRKIYNFFN